MTQPSQQQYQLPAPSDPVVTRVISNALFPEPAPRGPRGELLLPPGFPRAEEPMTWSLGEKHPLVDGFRIVRMFRTEEGVEVYSVSGEGQCTRTLLPMVMVRFVEETMSIDYFIEEIRIAEEGEDPGEEPDEPMGPGSDLGDPGDAGHLSDGAGEQHDALT